MEELGIDLEQTLKSGTAGMIAAGGILVISVLIVMIIIISKRWRGRILPLLIGLFGYSVFGFIFSNLVISLLTMLPGVGTSFEYNESSYILVYNLLIAVGFALARAFVAKLISARYDRAGDIYLAGTGIALGESIVMYGLSAMYTYIYASVIEHTGLETVISDMVENGLSTEEILTEYNSYISQLFEAPQVLWLLLGIATVLDIVLNVALMVVAFGVQKKQVQGMWICYGALIQFVAIMSFQMYNASSLTSIIVCFTVKLLVVAISTFFIMNYVARNITFNKE
ncbi:MAG: hypothetical protein ACI4E1_00870 [Lachnospira sp.]